MHPPSRGSAFRSDTSSPDSSRQSRGETLYVATSAERSTITAIDVRTFDVLDRWDVDGDVTGLGLSADGERLLAATSDDGLAMFDLDTGEELDGVAVRAPEPVTRVIPLGA